MGDAFSVPFILSCLKAMVAENQLRAFTDLYSTVWAFSSREAVEWLWGREYSMVWTLRMRTISP